MSGPVTHIAVAPGMLELSAMTDREDGIKERFYDALAAYKAHQGASK